VTDNIFIDHSRNDPVIDGLSDHDGKLVAVKNIESNLLDHNCEKLSRLMNNDTAKEFKTHLSNVTWE
jgi:hypothetical protein